MGIQKRYGYVLSGYTEYIGQYLILINGVLKFYSLVLPSGEVCISKYTPFGVYRLMANEILSVLGLNSGYTINITHYTMAWPFIEKLHLSMLPL